MNQQLANKVNSLIVSAYKALGSVLLALILLGLVTYLAVQGFFLLNQSWVAPTIVSPTDPEILQLNAQRAQQSAARDKLLAERREVQARLEDVTRVAQAERTFQQRFRATLGQQHQARQEELRQLARLREEYQGTRQEVVASNRAFAGLARGRSEALYGARLVDQEQHLTTQHHLAQLAQANLKLAESGVELQARVEALGRELRGLRAAREGQDAGDEARTPELLLLERESTRSALELARAEAAQQVLREDLASLDTAIARYERLLATIEGSPYLRAIEGGLTVAFVPYENQESARPGTPLYACAARLVWCREVGLVGQVLEGEVSVKHPIRQHFLRGVMVELQLRPGESAHEQLLHLGHPPLLL